MRQQSLFVSRIDETVAQALADDRLVGAVLRIAHGGVLLYRRAVGLFDREAGTPMREDAIFRLASVTKPLVTAAAMRLHEESRIDLHGPITRWLPDFRPALADGSRPAITLHHLLTHTSGLSYGFLEAPDSPYHRLGISDGLDQPGLSMEEALARIAQAPLAFAPGASWRYSLGLDVAGAVLEAATGKSLARLVREMVTDPLGLSDTAFAVTDRSRLAPAYANAASGPVRLEGTMAVPLWEGSVTFSPDRILDPASYLSGGAGMAGTADDMLVFLEAIRGGGSPILTPETVALMRADHVGPQTETQDPGWGFGYGGAVLTDPVRAETPQAVGTLRWGGAYGHSWFIDPVNRLSVVAFTNTAFEGMTGRFVTDLRDAIYAALPHRAG